MAAGRVEECGGRGGSVWREKWRCMKGVGVLWEG